MDTTEVRERVPEDLLEEIESLNSAMKAVHATLSDVLDRFDLVGATITELDSTNYPDGSGDLDVELMEEIGSSELYNRVHALTMMLDMYSDCEPSSFEPEEFERYGIVMPDGYEEHRRKMEDWYWRVARLEIMAEKAASA